MNDGYTRGQLEAWDDAHVWHPFTPHSVYREEEPLLIVAGEGNYLIDADDNRYLDGVASIWCNTFGHRRKEIDDAVRAQLGRIAHSTLLGNAGDRSILLAKRLTELAPPGLSKVFFSDNGSTAVEVALKMTLQYWQQVDGGGCSQKTKCLAFTGAYHGDTVGAVSLGGIELFHSRFRPLLFEVVRAPSPSFYWRPLGQTRQEAEREFIETFDRLISLHADQLAAVVMEPGMQGAGGMITHPDGFLKHVREVTRRHDILLIFDEVAMGIGRSGAMFAAERENVAPDFLCLAKGLTGGYLPLAATLTTERVYEAFLGRPEEGRAFFHGHTYTGNALGCAAALAVLDVFQRERVLDELPAKIEKLSTELERLREFPRHGDGGVGDIRQYGLAAGIELVADRGSREPFDVAARIGMKVCRLARECGVFLRPLGDVIVIMPPLSISEDEIELLVGAVEHGIRKALAP
jgi:adenosylmethionine-8-amino-7-oxononanoate aminotransferase